MPISRLLIVEDEAIVAMDIEDRLASLGYQLVGRTANGDDALKLAQKQRPDLVLMDIRLQGDMDGIAAAQEIRRRFHIPVIFLTAYSDDDTLERAKIAEPFGYLLKPFDDRELKSTIEMALYKQKTEVELRATHDRLELALQGADLGTWDWNVQTGAVVFDQRWAGMLGYSLDEISPHVSSWEKLVNPEDWLRVKGKLQAHLYGGTPAYETEHRLRHKSGEWIWILDKGKVIEWDAAGRPLRACGTHLDITESKQAESALRESLSLYQAALESTADGFLVVNLDGQIVSWNRKFTDMWRIPEEVIASKDNARVRDSILHQLQDPQAFLARVTELYNEPSLESCDLIDFKDGQVFERYSIPQYLDNRIVGRVLSFRDITARRQAEEWHQTVLRTIRDGYFLVSDQGQILDANEACCRLTGFTRPELSRLNVADLDAQQSPPELAANLRRMAAEGDALFETKLRTKAGRLVDVGISVTFLHWDDGRFVCFLRDITKRKQAEAEMEQLSEQRQLSLNAAHMGWWHYDPVTRVASWDRRHQEIFGLFIPQGPIDELFKLLHPDDLPHVWAAVGAALNPADPKPYASEFRVQRPDGLLRWIEARGLVRFDGEGDARQAVSFDGTVKDITDRKRDNQALQESERFIRNSFDSLFLHLAVLDGWGEIIYVNSAWEDFARKNGLDENSLGQNYLKICDESRGDWSQEAPLVAAGIRSVLAGETDNFSLEYPCHSPDEERFFVIRVTRFRGAGPVRVVVAHENITARKQAEAAHKQLEAQLFQAQKLEAIGTLAGGIAHDFNNMLWAIMGFSELTFNLLPEGSQERWNMQQVLDASKRARDLVTQILTFSRKADQEKKPVQIALIVKEALKLLRATIPTTIQIKQTISAPEALVLADPTQVHQIIMNLCTNAAQALRERGDTLEIGLGEEYFAQSIAVAHQELAPGPYVKLTVSDNGPGIAPDIIDKIFDPFFTTKEVGEGTGMGLAVIYGIVKSHEGAITVSSRTGSGAVFTVLLPKIFSHELEDREVKNSIPTGCGHILVIDDEEILVEMTKHQLEGLGYEVTTATSSLEALGIFQAQPDKFDLVITDQTMPHMDGLQLSREFRQIRPDITMILCTGFSERISKETVRAAGINALLMKPVNLRDLGEMVEKVLGKEKQ